MKQHWSILDDFQTLPLVSKKPLHIHICIFNLASRFSCTMKKLSVHQPLISRWQMCINYFLPRYQCWEAGIYSSNFDVPLMSQKTQSSNLTLKLTFIMNPSAWVSTKSFLWQPSNSPSCFGWFEQFVWGECIQIKKQQQDVKRQNVLE